MVKIATTGLSNINIEAEKLLEAAQDVQESTEATLEQKTAVWCRLSGLGGNNPYREQAIQQDFAKCVEEIKEAKNRPSRAIALYQSFVERNSDSNHKLVAEAEQRIAATRPLAERERSPPPTATYS